MDRYRRSGGIDRIRGTEGNHVETKEEHAAPMAPIEIQGVLLPMWMAPDHVRGPQLHLPAHGDGSETEDGACGVCCYEGVVTWHYLSANSEPSTYSPAPGVEYSQMFYSGTAPCVLSKLMPTPEASCSPGKPMGACLGCPSGMTSERSPANRGEAQ